MPEPISDFEHEIVGQTSMNYVTDAENEISNANVVVTSSILMLCERNLNVEHPANCKMENVKSVRVEDDDRV